MEHLGLKQDSDEIILNFISRVKAKARQCDLSIKCMCGKAVDFKDNFTLYMLVAEVNDSEIQKDLLTEEDLTLEAAEKRAIAKESAQYSQSGLAGENVQSLKATYQQEKTDLPNRKCGFCGLQEHRSREIECKAFSETCKRCGKIGHFQKVCRSRKIEKRVDDSKGDKKKDSENSCNNVFQISALSTADIVYDSRRRKWVQRQSSDKQAEKLPVKMRICRDSYRELNKDGTKSNVNTFLESETSVAGVPDTGCTTLCAGPDTCKKN